MSENIILTTGIYDLIKDQIRRKKVSKQEEDLLTLELKNATQVLRKELPEDVVTINRRVKVLDHSTQKEQEFLFVSPDKEKIKKGKHSIMSSMGLAIVGRKAGDSVSWPFADGEKKIEILEVKSQDI